MKSLKFIFPLILLVSCGNYFERKDGSATSSDFQLQLGRTITFEEVRTRVLEPAGCVSCHGQYKDYNSITKELEAIEQVILTDRMPPSDPLDNEQKGIILAWISSGAPAGEIVQAPVKEEGLVPTYESINRNIIGPKCVACHSPQGQVPFLDLSTRLAIFQQRNYLLNFDMPESSYIIEVITDPFEPMPPPESSFEAVTEEEVKVLTEWIRLGMP